MSKKDNPKIRWHLTDAERNEIRRLALIGLSNTAIAEQLHITRNAVALTKRKLGLPVWPSLPEAKILDLLRSGMNARDVAKTLRVSIRGTAKLAREHGFLRVHHELSAAKHARIDKMILHHEKSAMQIAKTCHACYKFCLRRAHELLEVERFLPVWKDPLRSNFPLGNNPPNAAGLST